MKVSLDHLPSSSMVETSSFAQASDILSRSLVSILSCSSLVHNSISERSTKTSVILFKRGAFGDFLRSHHAYRDNANTRMSAIVNPMRTLEARLAGVTMIGPRGGEYSIDEVNMFP